MHEINIKPLHKHQLIKILTLNSDVDLGHRTSLRIDSFATVNTGVVTTQVCYIQHGPFGENPFDSTAGRTLHYRKSVFGPRVGDALWVSIGPQRYDQRLSFNSIHVFLVSFVENWFVCGNEEIICDKYDASSGKTLHNTCNVIASWTLLCNASFVAWQV